MAPGHGDILMAQDNRRPVRRHSTMVTRERLIRAAAELMAERLSIDVSLSEIAQRSGLSAGLVQYHFGDKEELLLAVADWVLESSTQKTRELAASGISPREKLSGFIRGLVLLYRDFPFLTHLTIFLTSRGTPEENAAMSRRLIQPVVDVLDAMLEEGRNSGAFKPVPTAHVYYMCVGACDGVFQRRHTVRHLFDADIASRDVQARYVASVQAVILDGLVS